MPNLHFVTANHLLFDPLFALAPVSSFTELVRWREAYPLLHLLQPLHLELELVRVLLVVVEDGEGLAAVDTVRAAGRAL